MFIRELERFRMDPEQAYVTGTLTPKTPLVLANIPRYPNLAVYELRKGDSPMLGVVASVGKRRKLIATVSFNTGMSTYFYQPVPGLDVNYTKVLPQWQGQGIGLAVYRELILQKQWNLYATGSHSRGGEKLWQRLSQTPGIAVYVLQNPHVVVKPQLTPQGLRLPDGEDFYDVVSDTPWSLIAVAEDSPSNQALKKLVKKEEDRL